MAYIGMRLPLVGAVATRTDGSTITYSTPMIVGPAVSANVTFDTADNPDYGDDVVIDNDKGVNGYSITLETNDISKEARAAMLGWKTVSNTASPPVVTHYQITDAAPPEVGFGFIRVKLYKGTTKYEGFFCHCVQFSDSGENASTKQKQITWNHPSVSGAGIGVYIDSTGVAKYLDWMEFSTFSDAQTWLYGKFGANVPA